MYPPLTSDEVNTIGNRHSTIYIRHDGRDLCKECGSKFPCDTLRLAYEWLQTHIRESHDELKRLRDDEA